MIELRADFWLPLHKNEQERERLVRQRSERREAELKGGRKREEAVPQ